VICDLVLKLKDRCLGLSRWWRRSVQFRRVTTRHGHLTHDEYGLPLPYTLCECVVEDFFRSRTSRLRRSQRMGAFRRLIVIVKHELWRLDLSGNQGSTTSLRSLRASYPILLDALNFGVS